MMDMLEALTNELEQRLRFLEDEERKLTTALSEVRAALLRQEGAVEALKLAMRRVEITTDSPPRHEDTKTATDGDGNG